MRISDWSSDVCSSDLVLSYLILTLPFTTWVLTAFMRELPRELEEAAIVDGAPPWRILAGVFLPLMAPALAATGLLAFILAWNEFLFALTFTLSPEQRTVPRSEEHTSELQSLMRISYAVFCLKKTHHQLYN